MKNVTKQVVILDNFSSPYIHQAILILKDYNPSLESKVIEEAERVVAEYLSQSSTVPPRKKPFSAAWAFFGLFAVLAAAVIAYLLQ